MGLEFGFGGFRVLCFGDLSLSVLDLGFGLGFGFGFWVLGFGAAIWGFGVFGFWGSGLSSCGC